MLAENACDVVYLSIFSATRYIYDSLRFARAPSLILESRRRPIVKRAWRPVVMRGCCRYALVGSLKGERRFSGWTRSETRRPRVDLRPLPRKRGVATPEQRLQLVLGTASLQRRLSRFFLSQSFWLASPRHDDAGSTKMMASLRSTIGLRRCHCSTTTTTTWRPKRTRISR